MRSKKFLISLFLVALGITAFAASATAAVPPPAATAASSPFDLGQPDVLADDWSPLIDAARGEELPPAPPGDDGLSMDSGGSICGTASECWIDGAGTYQYFPNCIVGGYGYVYTYVGYWGRDDFSYPQTGDRYWGHLVSGVVGSSCGGEYIGTDVQLPTATQFDLDGTPEGRIRCFYTSGKTGNTEEITDHAKASCKQNPGPGVYGGYGLGGRIIPAYGTFEVIFPIKSSQQNLGTSKLIAALDTALSTPKVAYPSAMVAVTQSTNPGPGPGPGPGPNPNPNPDPNPDPGEDPFEPDPIDEGPTPRATPLTAKLAAAGKQLSLTGMVTADRAGDTVQATLYRSAKKGKPFRSAGATSGAVSASGGYALSFKRPKKGRCKATVTVAAEPSSGFEAATTTVSGKC